MKRVALAALLLALAAAVAWNSATRLRRFSFDSMVYVDVARNVAAGRGLGYSTFGLNDPRLPIERTPPVPLTTFAPLYPLAVGGVTRLPFGVEAAEAALVLAALCGFAVVALGGALARRAWGNAAGLLALAILLVHAPLHRATTTAWSETLGVALLLGSMLALPGRRPRGEARAALSGLLGGLAFATRYALAPWLALAPALLLVDGMARRERLRGVARACAWAAAALVPAAIVMARNFALDGELVPGAGPARSAFAVNLAAAARGLFGGFAGERAWAAQAAVLVAALLLAVVATWRRERSLRALFAGAALAPLAWTASYAAFLVYESTVRGFDPIKARLLLPATAAGACVVAGGLARGLRVPVRAAAVALALAMAWVAVREARLAHDVPPRTTAQEIAASPRLAWLAVHAGPRDLLIGDDMVDVAFWLRRPCISYEDWEGYTSPTPEKLRAWCALHRRTFDRAWIVLNDRWPHARDWGRRYGPFFARLATGRDTSDTGVVPAAVLGDGIVYRYDPWEAPDVAAAPLRQ